MLISSVILVLQETLEAALMVSVLMAISHRLKYRIVWLPWGLSGGAILSSLYAMNMQTVSEWFDYVGQEVTNAFLQAAITFVIIILLWAIFWSTRENAPANKSFRKTGVALFQLCAAIMVVLTITREGSEVLIFLSGAFQAGEKVQAILIGGGIGFSIGISVSVLLFYGLMGLSEGWGVAASILLMSLFAGNMLSQAALLLTQADWLSSGQPLWDTTAWIAENTVIGQLLYALVGYEATPSLAQVLGYSAGTVTALGIAVTGRYWANPNLFPA